MPSYKRRIQIAKKKEIQNRLNDIPPHIKQRMNARKNGAIAKSGILKSYFDAPFPKYLNRKGGLIKFTSAYDFEIYSYKPSQNKANRGREEDRLENIKKLKLRYADILHLKSCAKIIASKESKLDIGKAIQNESGSRVSLSTIYSYLNSKL